jgi:ribose transport system permease protein
MTAAETDTTTTAVPPPRKTAGAAAGDWLARVSLAPYTGVIVALIGVSIFLSITQSAFFTWANFTTIVGANTGVLILAVGETFVILSGGIDLSTASAATATGMILGLALNAGWGFVLAFLAMLGLGLVIGLANGILITKAKISFLVVTLGALSIWQSFALVVYNGQTVSVFGHPGFSPINAFVNNGVGPIPILLIFDVGLAIVASVVLRYMPFGRSVFAIGSNVEAARLNGINVSRVLIIVYTIAGVAAAIAGLVAVGRLTAADPTVDPTLLLTVLAAVLIGGTSFSGGEGGILGTVIGVLFLGVIQNGLTLSNVSAFWQGMVSGVVLIAAVGLSVLRHRGYRAQQKRAARRGARTEVQADT